MNLPKPPKIIFPSIFFLLVFILLSFLSPGRVFAREIDGDVNCDDNLRNCTCGPGTWRTVNVFEACAANNVVQENVCAGASSLNTGPQKCGTIGPWDFCYATECQAQRISGTDQCEFRYRYSNYTQCSAADRTYDPSIPNLPSTVGGQAGTGYDPVPPSTGGRVLPGICSASSYNGSDPNTACLSGGHYKTCCETRNGVQTGNRVTSRDGVCPDLDPRPEYSAVLTAPGITSCTPESITSPPPGGGGGSCGWNFLRCGWEGWIGTCHVGGSACVKVWWWNDGGDPSICVPTGNICSGWGRSEWGLDCGQGNACAVTLLSPSNGATGLPTTITFDWTDAPCWGYACARGSYTINYSERHYELQLRKVGESTWTNVVRLTGSDGPPAKNPDSIYTYTLPEQGSYEWRVKSFWELIAGGAPRQGSSFSSTWTFATIINEGGWFQVKDADIQSGGNLVSKIPAQCVLPDCDPKFDLDGVGGYPGVCAYGGTTANFGSGTVSSKGWLANSGYAGRRYDYAFFEKLTPDGAFQTPITESEITGGDLISGFQSGGYIWRYRNGNLTINGTTNLGIRKVILLVDGNLTINGRITLDDGTGFFAAFVSGNITVDPTVSHPNQPALEGVFMADGTISTGTRITSSDDRLYIRGMMAAWGGINLQRDLDPTKASGANNTSAAEFIEYAPDLVFSFPRELARRGIVWREIAP